MIDSGFFPQKKTCKFKTTCFGDIFSSFFGGSSQPLQEHGSMWIGGSFFVDVSAEPTKGLAT